MANDFKHLMRFALEVSMTQNDQDRAEIYRGMAVVCGDEQDQTKLRRLAGHLEEVEKLCADLKFSFSEKTTDDAPLGGNGDREGNGR